MFAATFASASDRAMVKSMSLARAVIRCCSMAFFKKGRSAVGVGSIVDMPAAIFSNLQVAAER